MISYGTGSYPQFLNRPNPGLHLDILRKDNIIPLKAPYFFIASYEYCEQDGINRQQATLRTESAWYALIKKRKTRCNILNRHRFRKMSRYTLNLKCITSPS
jgi:hypothetical protein